MSALSQIIVVPVGQVIPAGATTNSVALGTSTDTVTVTYPVPFAIAPTPNPSVSAPNSSAPAIFVANIYSVSTTGYTVQLSAIPGITGYTLYF